MATPAVDLPPPPANPDITHSHSQSPSPSLSSSKRQSAHSDTIDGVTVAHTHLVASHSPFPSPSSSFVPPPMPASHEYAVKRGNGGLVVNGKENVKKKAEEIDTSATSASLGGGLHTPSLGASTTPTTPTPATPTPASMQAQHAKDASSSSTASTASTVSAEPTTSTPTPVPTTPTAPSASTSAPTPTPSTTASKHTSLSSSRPAPASPSQPPSRRQSLSSKRASQLSQSSNSRRHSTLSTTSNLSRSSTRRSSKRSSRIATRASQTKAPRSNTIHIRDFAYDASDPRHTMTGPDTPKPIRKLLKKYGPGAKRRSSAAAQYSSSGDSTETEVDSRRSSGILGRGWDALKWGVSGFGMRWSGSGGGGGSGWGGSRGSGSGTGGGGGGYPSQSDFERNFDDGIGVDAAEDDGDDEEGEFYDEEYAGEEGEPGDEGPLSAGVYMALFDFEPEGTAEMKLVEGQEVRVVGRGGGVGWAVVIRDGEGAKEGEQEEYALVPESYLKFVRALEEDGDEADEEE